jgi:hypothetical protein
MENLWLQIGMLILSTAMGVMGWFARVLWTSVNELQKEFSLFRENLPLYYTRKDDFIDLRNDLKTMLSRIEDKIDRKADK